MDGTLRSNSAWLIDCLSLVNLNFMLFCLNVSLFDAAILTSFEISTKSFLKIFFLVSRQSSRNRQFGIVKAVFDRQLFFRQSSINRQLIVNRSSIVSRQSSIVNRSSTAQKRRLIQAVLHPFVSTCVTLCFGLCYVAFLGYAIYSMACVIFFVSVLSILQRYLIFLHFI